MDFQYATIGKPLLVIISDRSELRDSSGSTLALARAGIDQGHNVWFGELGSFSFRGETLEGRVYQITYSGGQFQPEDLLRERRARLEEFFLVLLRAKQSNYHEEDLRVLGTSSVRFDNHPLEILRYCSKLSPLKYTSYTPETFVSSSIKAIREYIQQSSKREWILKPVDDFRGRGIHRTQGDVSFEQLQTIREDHGPYSVVQEYLPVTDVGDKRVLVVHGKPVAWGTRFPAEGRFLANHHAGGHYQATELSEEEKKIVRRVGKDLSKKGLNFAGVDFIAGKITEINVGSIGSVVSLDQFFEFDLPTRILDELIQNTNIQR